MIAGHGFPVFAAHPAGWAPQSQVVQGWAAGVFLSIVDMVAVPSLFWPSGSLASVLALGPPWRLCWVFFLFPFPGFFPLFVALWWVY